MQANSDKNFQQPESGILTPGRLLGESNNVKAPLHSAFEWDDAVAGHAYRLDQAEEIITSLVAVQEGQPLSEATPVYVSVANPETGTPAFVTVEEAMRNKTMREQVLSNAVREMESFESLYRPFEELSEVIAAYKEVRERIATRIEQHPAI